MDEPWYESQGPNIEYAKNDIYSNINMYLSRFPQLTSENIKQIFAPPPVLHLSLLEGICTLACAPLNVEPLLQFKLFLTKEKEFLQSIKELLPDII